MSYIPQCPAFHFVFATCLSYCVEACLMEKWITYNMNTKQLVEQEKDLEEGTETEKSEKEKDEETKRTKERQVFFLVNLWVKPWLQKYPSDISWWCWCSCLHGADNYCSCCGGDNKGYPAPACKLVLVCASPGNIYKFRKTRVLPLYLSARCRSLGLNIRGMGSFLVMGK